jgi:hypothetical protein
MKRTKVTFEEPLEFKDLEKRIDPQHRILFVKNSPRGIIIDEEARRESWGDLGYQGDGRRNRYAIEVRARNGRVVAAVAWWENPDRNNCVSTLGTYVSKTMRRRGIGTSLWKAMIEVTAAKVVYSEPVTDEGLTLVRSLREKLRGVKIEMIDSGDLEFLEDLRRQKRRAS